MRMTRIKMATEDTWAKDTSRPGESDNRKAETEKEQGT